MPQYAPGRTPRPGASGFAPVPPLSNADCAVICLSCGLNSQAQRQAAAAAGSLDDAKLAQFTRDASFKTVVDDVKFGKGGG